MATACSPLPIAIPGTVLVLCVERQVFESPVDGLRCFGSQFRCAFLLCYCWRAQQYRGDDAGKDAFRNRPCNDWQRAAALRHLLRFSLRQPFIIVLEDFSIFQRQFSGKVLVQGGAIAAAKYFPFEAATFGFVAGQRSGLE